MERQIRPIDLDKQTRQELEEQIRHTKERKIADRLRVLLYKAEGQSHREIAQRLQMSRTQVSRIMQRYLKGIETVTVTTTLAVTTRLLCSNVFIRWDEGKDEGGRMRDECEYWQISQNRLESNQDRI